MTESPYRPDRIYLGWEQVPAPPDPGPPPPRPAPGEPVALDPGWVAAQRREERRISRRPRRAVAGCAVALAVIGAAGWTGTLSPALTGAVAMVFAVPMAVSLRVIVAGQAALRATLAAETRRVAAARSAREGQLAAEREDHARRFRDWQARQQAHRRRAQWYPVCLPEQVGRVDVAGGTLAGWSALLTTLAAPRLATGGEVTVVDLSPGPAGRDLVALARRWGHHPLVWVLPGDLPRFDLGVGMPAGPLADVLAVSASADDREPGPGATARDLAIIDRVLRLLDERAGIAAVLAGLRALGQIGDPRRDIEQGLLSPGQLDAITGLFGRSATDRVVAERAWALEARLRPLAGLGSDPVALPRSRLRVIAVDPGSAAPDRMMLGAYVTAALTHLLRQLAAGRRWRHTLCVLGAERLRTEVLDGLSDACETTGAGLLLAFRTVPAPVRVRLGRGDAAVAFMRLGNAEEAKAAAEQIGTEHRFVISQLTDTVGSSMTGTATGSYSSTVGASESASASVSASRTSGRSRGHGQSRPNLAPLSTRTGTGHRDVSESVATSESLSLSEGITVSTSWGLSTAAAIGASESLARTAQRSREFVVEPDELQRLPPSAIIVTHPCPDGRRVVLADANPAIAALPGAGAAGGSGPGSQPGRGGDQAAQ